MAYNNIARKERHAPHCRGGDKKTLLAFRRETKEETP